MDSLSLPTGTVTFLFTDIEGSTPLWERMPAAMKLSLERHNASIQDAVQANGGVIFKFIGDEFQCAFSQPALALQAAMAAQHNLAEQAWGETGPIRVRMGLHTGPAEAQGTDYLTSHTLNRVARIRSAGHGGQVLLSQATVELLRGQLTGGVQLLDLGEYHLKGMLQAERIYQAVEPGLICDFPPLMAEKSIVHNLPEQLTSFIGREKEIVQVKELLKSSRLVTLTGSGGVGKTRLALRVAQELVEALTYKNGVWLVELAPVGDGALIPRAIADIFGLTEVPGRSLKDTLLDYLGEKQLLLILDNCEHLIANCAELADSILRHCRTVRFLASSREALGIAGETAFYVPSLPTPDPLELPSFTNLSEYAVIALFVERAHQAMPGFALTSGNAPSLAQICRRLDGIPLAIELAAARVKVLSLEQIAARLDDRFLLLTGGSRRALPRHQTLHSLIDWSYDLLSEAERHLLRSLSVFSGEWTLDAAEAVCGDGRGMEVVDLLSQLVNKSLVMPLYDEGEVSRYRMLETIRQYAQEKLLEAGEAEAQRDRHLDFYRRLAEISEIELKSEKIFTRLPQLDAEIDNLRLAIGWAFGGLEPARTASGLHLVSHLMDYWYIRGLWGEGSDWLRKGLSLLPDEPHAEAARAIAGYAAGILILLSFDFSRMQAATNLLDESVKLYRSMDDHLGEALAQCALGATMVAKFALSSRQSWIKEEYIQAHELGSEGLTICRDIADKNDLAFALLLNGYIEGYGPQANMVLELTNESLSLYKETGNRLYQSYISNILGFTALARGDYDAVRSYTLTSLHLAGELKNQTNILWASYLPGLSAYYEGDFAQMESNFQTVAALGRETGNLTSLFFALRNLGIAALRQGQPEKAAGYFLENLSRAQKIEGYDYDERVFIVCMAGVAASLGQFETAARLLGAAEAHFEGFFKSLDAWDQAENNRITTLTRSRLEENAFTAAWTAGRRLTLESAIHEAREVIQV